MPRLWSRAGAVALLVLLAACDGEPSADAIAVALEVSIRQELAEQLSVAPAAGSSSALHVGVRDVEIRHAAPVTDYWTLWVTFTLDLAGRSHDQDVNVRARRVEDGWEVISIQQRWWDQ